MTVSRFGSTRMMIETDIGVVKDQPSAQWILDSMRWTGKVLTGYYAHWCPDWDFLPVDETRPEWPCPCNMSDGVGYVQLELFGDR